MLRKKKKEKGKIKRRKPSKSTLDAQEKLLVVFV